ncbi:hypothetical protein DFH09DRAFT_833454, partial [Mycena vulgaris]
KGSGRAIVPSVTGLRQVIRARSSLDYLTHFTEQKLLSHTESAVKRRKPQISHLKTNYNKLCDAIATEIRMGRAPRGSIAP